MADIGKYEKKDDFKGLEDAKLPSVEKNVQSELDVSLKNLSGVLSVTTIGDRLSRQCWNGFDRLMNNYRRYQEEGLEGNTTTRTMVVAGRILWESAWVSNLIRANKSIQQAFQELSLASKAVKKAEAHVQRLTYQAEHCRSASRGRAKKVSLSVQIHVHHEIYVQRQKEFDAHIKKLKPVFQEIQQAFSKVERKIINSRFEIRRQLEGVQNYQKSAGAA